MLDVSRDIHSLTDFKRNTASFMEQLQNQTASAFLLTVNGKAELAVMSAKMFQHLLNEVDELETIRGIRRGINQADRGEGISPEELEAKIRQSDAIPRNDHAGGTSGD
ncbi:MAG: hypothetical protein ACPGXK_04845 [Phycisphaerae bacterium]